MGLNKEQAAAVEYLEGPLLVLAGPGTGKTQLLSAKVAHILEQTDANPYNILCITFTDAGAENMRSRLQSMIGTAALEVNIYTYHAFGSNLLERYKNYSESFERRLESPIDAVTQYRIIHEIQRQLPMNNILKTADINDIISTISNAKSARLTASDLRKIAEQNVGDSAQISAEISPILLNYKTTRKPEEAIKHTYQPILEILAKYSSPQPIVDRIEPIANILARELNQVIKNTLEADKPSVKPLTTWRNKRFEACVETRPRISVPTALGELAQTTERQPVNSKTYRLKDHIANKKLLALSDIMSAYELDLSERGLFDFDDMIEQAIYFLKNDPGFRAELQEQFQYVLLDEFQDTNPSQFELIKLITDYEQPIVMAVGDDDQAIFEFQGASASNLRDFREHYQAEVITLKDNYRSTDEILTLSRHITDQLDDSFSKNYQIDKKLRSMKDLSGKNPQVRIYRHEFIAPEVEYNWIGQEIRKLIDAGESPNEIAVIAPKHKNIAPILPFLKAQSIDVAYEKRDNLLQDPLMLELVKFARFINHLACFEPTSHLLLQILAFPCWEVPPDLAVQTVQDCSEKNAIAIMKKTPELEKIKQLFAALATSATESPLELWLDQAIGTVEVAPGLKSPYLAYYEAHLSEAELLEFYENLATLRQTVLAHMQNADSSASQKPKLVDFVRMLDDYELSEIPIMRISLYQDSCNSIQVMTSHKSKGLEFKYVFLISMDDAAWGKSKGNNNKLSLPCNLAQIRHTGATDDEKLRLLFVAITRAKEVLYLTNAVQRSDGKELARSRYLAEPSRESEPISPFLPDAAQKISIHNDELTLEQKINTLQKSWISNYFKLSPNVHDLLIERMANYRLNASDLTNFIDLIYGGPQAFYHTRVLRAPNEPATFSLYLGNLMHAAFELITKQGLDDDAALDWFTVEAKKAALDPDSLKQLIEHGQYALRTSLAEFGGILRHQHAKAEVNLSPERLHLGDVPITGKIDHLRLDPEAKTIEIYDFKTGKFHEGKWNSHSTLYKYRMQLGFYKLLLNQSPTYQKYQVTKGHILFVSPDPAEGRVHSATYDFTANENQQDELELKKLIPIVYQQVHTLAFLENEEICLPSDQTKEVADIKNFVAKLLELGE